MPGTIDSRAKTCGYCGRQLKDMFYRDLARSRGFFCSGDHAMKYVENGKQAEIPGLREDEVQSLPKVNKEGYVNYQDRDDPDVEPVPYLGEETKEEPIEEAPPVVKKKVPTRKSK